jgi:hypothetical protein
MSGIYTENVMGTKNETTPWPDEYKTTPGPGTVEEWPLSAESGTWRLDSWTFVLLALYLLVFLVGTVANVLLIVGMCKKSGSGILMTSKSNVVINLCVADLLLSVVCVPATAQTILFKSWDWGLVLCKFSIYLRYSTVAGSTFSFMTLSVDRYADHRCEAPSDYRKYILK